jgi:hypothetical protein
MSPKALAAALLATAALAPQAMALKVTRNDTTIPKQSGYFGIEVKGTDLSYYGRSEKIVSVSFQDYIIYGKEYPAGAVIVSEVTLDMDGSAQQVRIYSIRPPGTADVSNRVNAALAANAQNRELNAADARKLPIPGQLSALESKAKNVINSATAGMVVKTYPNTTHSKTVEMVVSSKEELLAFYNTMKKLTVKLPVEVVDGTPPAGTVTSAGTQQKITLSNVAGCLFVLE